MVITCFDFPNYLISGLVVGPFLQQPVPKIASGDHHLFYAGCCGFVFWPIEYSASDSVSSLKRFAAFSMVPSSIAIMPGGHSHSPVEAYLERNWGLQSTARKNLPVMWVTLKVYFIDPVKPSAEFSTHQYLDCNHMRTLSQIHRLSCSSILEAQNLWEIINHYWFGQANMF